MSGGRGGNKVGRIRARKFEMEEVEGGCKKYEWTIVTRNGGCNCFPIIIRWCTTTFQNPSSSSSSSLTNSLSLSFPSMYKNRKIYREENKTRKVEFPSAKWSIEEMEERRIWKKEKGKWKDASEFQRGEWRKRRNKGTLMAGGESKAKYDMEWKLVKTGEKKKRYRGKRAKSVLGQWVYMKIRTCKQEIQNSRKRIID